ncbi:MAG: hypothetical protein AB1489_19055 [Acidobacteriota bacterium]
MRLTEEEMKQLYQQQTTRRAEQRQQCLSAEQLYRAASNQLSEAEREQVAEHMLECLECTQEYRLARTLKPWSETLVEASEEPSASIVAMPARRALVSVRVLYGVAATLLIVSISLGVMLQWLRREHQQEVARYNAEIAERDRRIAAVEETLTVTRQELAAKPVHTEEYETQLAEQRKVIEELSQPQVNVPIVDLDPSSAIRGSGDSTAIIKVPIGTNFCTLILNTRQEQVDSYYAIEIMDRINKIVWQDNRVRQNQLNPFTITLPRRLFPAGQYRIKLYGLDKSERKLIEAYSIQIKY